MPKREAGVMPVEKTLNTAEREVLKKLTGEFDIHPRDVVVLESKRHQNHKDFDPEDGSTWKSRRYYFKKQGAIYELYLDARREDGDDEPVGLWAEAVLCTFPTEELLVRFAQIEARKAAVGKTPRLLPASHPDYDPAAAAAVQDVDTSQVKLKKVSIQDRHDPEGLMEGSDPETGKAEIGSAPDGRPDQLGDVTPPTE